MLLRKHVPIFCSSCFFVDSTSCSLLLAHRIEEELSEISIPSIQPSPIFLTFCFSETNCVSFSLVSAAEWERADVVEETRSNLCRGCFFSPNYYITHTFLMEFNFRFLWILSILSLSLYHCLDIKRCRLDQYSASWFWRQRIPGWQKISTANLRPMLVEREVRDQKGLIRLMGIWVASSCPSR